MVILTGVGIIIIAASSFVTIFALMLHCGIVSSLVRKKFCAVHCALCQFHHHFIMMCGAVFRKDLFNSVLLIQGQARLRLIWC